MNFVGKWILQNGCLANVNDAAFLGREPFRARVFLPGGFEFFTYYDNNGDTEAGDQYKLMRKIHGENAEEQFNELLTKLRTK